MYLKFRIVAITIIISVIMSASFANASELQSAANISIYPKPMQIGDLVLKSPTGQNVSLKDFRGKVVLLHFWSIQCPACKIEEPLLEQLKKTYGNSGLEILGVNLVDPAPVVAQYATANHIPFPILFDGGHGFSLKTVSMSGRNTAFLINPGKEAILEIPGFPTTYIIDCTGNAVGYSVGVARWDSMPAAKLLQSLLADSKTCKLAMNLQPTQKR